MKKDDGIAVGSLPFSHRMTAARRALAGLVLMFVAGMAVSGAPPPPAAASIVGEIAAVERIRGLRFTAPVKTMEIDRRDLPRRLREQFAKSLPYSVQDWGDVLRALHLIGAEEDEAIVAALLDLYQAQVLAYYDPKSKTFYTVRQPPAALQGLAMSPDLEAGVVVHELTHALQDQHFAIGAKDLALRDDADANLAYHALVEGEASLVMFAWLTEKSGASFDEMIRSDFLAGALSSAAAQNMPLAGPHYFVEMMKFPYLDGLRFVIEAYRRGGWKELDRVYANPPRSTREILHPDDYFEHRFAPAPFNTKPAIAVPRLLSVEHLGEWHWRFLAGDVRGWISDRVTIAQNEFCESTVLVETEWDTNDHARRFYDAYKLALDEAGAGSLATITDRKVRVGYGADRSLMERFLSR